MTFKKEVVGSGKASLDKSKPKPSLSTSTQSNLDKAVNDKLIELLKQSGVDLAANIEANASAGIIGDLTDKEIISLGQMLNDMGYNFKTVEAVRTALVGGDFPAATTQKDFTSLVKYLKSQEIPALASGPSVTQTITQYDDKYLKSVGNSIAQDFLGRNLTNEEVAKIMPKLKDIVNKGTTTTSKKVGGKNVVTTTPGFSQAAAQDVVQTELRLGASQDLQQKQYIDFADWLSKNMAGM